LDYYQFSSSDRTFLLLQVRIGLVNTNGIVYNNRMQFYNTTPFFYQILHFGKQTTEVYSRRCDDPPTTYEENHVVVVSTSANRGRRA